MAWANTAGASCGKSFIIGFVFAFEYNENYPTLLVKLNSYTV